jgi:hypothetical protein
MLGALPGDRRKFLFRRAASMVLPPGSRPQCRVLHAVNGGIPAIGWLCKDDSSGHDRGIVGVSRRPTNRLPPGHAIIGHG